MRSLIAIVIGIILCSCASMPRTQDVPVANTPHKIYFIYRGWHTSILLDANMLAAYSPLLAPELHGQQYARIGFGDGDYFTGKSKTFGSATRALFASHYSAVQLLTYDYPPFAEIPEETRVPLFISERGMHALIAHINHSIALDAQGQPLKLPALGEAMGNFYQANIHYSAFSNCNTWSGQALRAAGLPIADRLTASGVFEQAKVVARIQATARLSGVQSSLNRQ